MPAEPISPLMTIDFLRFSVFILPMEHPLFYEDRALAQSISQYR